MRRAVDLTRYCAYSRYSFFSSQQFWEWDPSQTHGHAPATRAHARRWGGGAAHTTLTSHYSVCDCVSRPLVSSLPRPDTLGHAHADSPSAPWSAADGTRRGQSTWTCGPACAASPALTTVCEAGHLDARLRKLFFQFFSFHSRPLALLRPHAHFVFFNYFIFNSRLRSHIRSQPNCTVLYVYTGPYRPWTMEHGSDYRQCHRGVPKTQRHAFPTTHHDTSWEHTLYAILYSQMVQRYCVLHDHDLVA